MLDDSQRQAASLPAHLCLRATHLAKWPNDEVPWPLAANI